MESIIPLLVSFAILGILDIAGGKRINVNYILFFAAVFVMLFLYNINFDLSGFVASSSALNSLEIFGSIIVLLLLPDLGTGDKLFLAATFLVYPFWLMWAIIVLALLLTRPVFKLISFFVKNRRMSVPFYPFLFLAAVELDKAARTTYLENHGHGDMRMYEDIRDVNPDDLPEFDIITGGFPCQSFSSAGDRLGYKDPKKGALFFEIKRLAQARKPSLMILENVEGFATHEGGKTAETAMGELAKIGYSVSMKILCASEFGVPQQRKRIFIVAVRLDCFHAQERPFAFPAGTTPETVVADILEQNVTTGIWDRPMHPDSNIRTDKTGLIPLGRIDGKNYQNYRVYSAEAQGPTLCTSHSGRYLVGDKIRTLTPRECARMQGFPESFKLNPNDTQSIKQFGNAVAVPVVSAVAMAASSFL